MSVSHILRCFITKLPHCMERFPEETLIYSVLFWNLEFLQFNVHKSKTTFGLQTNLCMHQKSQHAEIKDKKPSLIRSQIKTHLDEKNILPIRQLHFSSLESSGLQPSSSLCLFWHILAVISCQWAVVLGQFQSVVIQIKYTELKAKCLLLKRVSLHNRRGLTYTQRQNHKAQNIWS